MADFEWFTKLHRSVFHHTHGWIGGHLGQPMVLMYTVGAKTGLPRPIPVQYYPAGADGVMVLASNNGQPNAPGWYYNLKAHPEIDALVGREKRRIRAEELTAEQREKVWPAMRKQNRAIDKYATRAGRALPVMLLRTVHRDIR